MKIWKYIKAAVANPLNLLGVVGGLGASWYFGQPELGAAVVAAELAWLGFAVTSTPFRRHVDISEHQKAKADRTEAAERRMRRMLFQMPRGARDRYTRLMKQCDELRDITKQYQIAQGADDNDLVMAEMQLEGLDRLLWLFLKLLYTEHSLNRFFETTSIDEIEKELDEVQAQLSDEQNRLNLEQREQRERILTTLQDNLSTIEERRRNFQQARENFELVRAEQTRLENKIRSLAEMGISKGNPDELSGQVDSVSGSLAETEKMLDDLGFISGLSAADDDGASEVTSRPSVHQK